MAESFTVFVDARFTAEERRVIGRAIVDYVVNRTERGRGINNVPFRNSKGSRSYSKAYQEHRDFDIASKRRAPINLTLTGDMLVSLEVLDTSLAGRIVIGIEDGENADKAKWMREKGYNFMGISQKEQNTILARFSKVTPEEIKRSNIAESVASSFLRGLFRG